MTVISIDTNSLQKNPSGRARRLPEAEVAALALACCKLLEELGDLGRLVEVLKVVPWHGFNHPNIFDIKAVVSVHGDATKVEATRTFEHSVKRDKPNWDLEALSTRIVSEMKREICNAVQNKISNLTQTSERWKNLIPKDKVA